MIKWNCFLERRRVPWADCFRTRPLFIGGTETEPSVQGGTKMKKSKLFKRALAAILTMTYGPLHGAYDSLCGGSAGRNSSGYLTPK